MMKIQLTSPERVLYETTFKFWFETAKLSCQEANAKAYEKVINKRKLAKSLQMQGLTH